MPSSSPPPQRLSMLPIELDDIDAGWGDEPLTLSLPPSAPVGTATPSVQSPLRRATTAQTRPTVPRRPLLAPPPEFIEDDISDRVTTLPEEPQDEFARRLMAAAATELPPAFRPSEPPPARPPLTQREPLSLLERVQREITPLFRPGEPSAQEFSGRFSSAPPSEDTPLHDLKDRFAIGDFSGALEVAEKILAESPDDVEVQTLAQKCRDVLSDMYTSRIVSMDRPLHVLMGTDQIRWLSLDHRAGFLLAMIDGVTTVDELLDVSGMSRFEALRLICDLLEKNVVGF